mgnify:CR=1 FL=1
MGSEMCIRDSGKTGGVNASLGAGEKSGAAADNTVSELLKAPLSCLLYTSDAADERSSVDLGGRRIIKKKTTRDMEH